MKAASLQFVKPVTNVGVSDSMRLWELLGKPWSQVIRLGGTNA
ncbi:hypothetical protein ARTHRO9V_160135 [Arthrobacter sp. 9V]|nr:hypothetical protein [Arthrobacter sp. 9V]VXB51838.1 hypothetical protein ARTHRO9V_160135 [Arthrobacter sp. 9V]